MADFIVIVILIVLVGSALAYIIKEKKKGAKCIGCPAAGCCARKQNNASPCSCGSGSKAGTGGCHTDKKK